MILSQCAYIIYQDVILFASKLFSVSDLMRYLFYRIMLSTLYSQSKIATACGGIVFFMSCLPCLFISIREQSLTILVSFWTKLICSLSSTSAFGMASKYLLYYEINGITYGCRCYGLVI